MSTIAIGCMRLSTELDRDDERSIAVLHAAFDAGVTLLDTADAYCWDDSERGHNERLIARALASWKGDRTRMTVATKGGMTRPDGRWEADGRAKHLAAACEGSCRALGVNALDLYQLHAVDSRVPLATSVRALASLKRNGLIKAIGLCNVTVGQIEAARRITEIEAIQVEASVWHDAPFLNGVAEYCLANGLMLLAHRPLGGRRSKARTAAHPVLNAIGSRHGATPFEVALRWLTDLSGTIVPLPGVTRVETAQSTGRAQRVELTDDDRAILDDVFPAGRPFRAGHQSRVPVAVRPDVEVVLIMGLPGAGKTTLAQRYVADGYQRLNRDETGGTLRELAADLYRALASGASRIVLDNTYLSRRSRAEVIRAARDQGAPVRCTWLSTSIEDAQVNVVERMIDRDGTLPDMFDKPKGLSPQPVLFPTALFRAQRELELPDPSEGFSRIEIVPFERRRHDAYTNRAAIVWCDDVLMRSRSGARTPVSPDDVVVDPRRAEVLRRYQDHGWKVLGLSWQPEIADGSRTDAQADAIFARMNELMTGGDKPSGVRGDKPSGLSMAIEVHYCPHPAGPPRCWCRKPLPGLGVLLIHRHQLDPAQCIYVGDGPQDPGFARKLGFACQEAGAFFTDRGDRVTPRS